MAEVTEPAEVMKTLNDYFAGWCRSSPLHGGVVNKFDGDAVMAFFGILPKYIPPKVSALQATHAGLEMLEHIRSVNKERTEAGKQAFEMGIGISTGTVIAGGLGSEDRVHYTVVGDTSIPLSGSSRSPAISGNRTRDQRSDLPKTRTGTPSVPLRAERLGPTEGQAARSACPRSFSRSSTLIGRQVVNESIQEYTGSLPRVAEILSGETTKEIEKTPKASEGELEFIEDRLEGMYPARDPCRP